MLISDRYTKLILVKTDIFTKNKLQRLFRKAKDSKTHQDSRYMKQNKSQGLRDSKYK